MSGFERTTDRSASFFIYLIMTLIVLGAGFKLINHSAKVHFYYDYLLKWESALTRLFSKDIELPHFSGENHIEYMNKLVKLMKNTSIEVPQSNTHRPYVYQISEKGLSERQNIFLLCLEKKIILYGLPKTIFNMLDNNIDGQLDNKTGKFKGKLQKDKKHYAAIWEL
jgi:hypothetical protein